MIRAATGAAATTQSVQCGQGPRTSVSYRRFHLLSEGTRFVGWDLSADGGRTLPFSTADGVRVGSTLAQVRARYSPVTITRGSLGAEFLIGSADPVPFGGLLTGTSASSTVTTLYSGQTCFAR